MPQNERLRVWKGELKKTSGGLTKGDLIKNKRGKVVSKKKSEAAKKNSENNLGSWLRSKGDQFLSKGLVQTGKKIKLDSKKTVVAKDVVSRGSQEEGGSQEGGSQEESADDCSGGADEGWREKVVQHVGREHREGAAEAEEKSSVQCFLKRMLFEHLSMQLVFQVTQFLLWLVGEDDEED